VLALPLLLVVVLLLLLLVAGLLLLLLLLVLLLSRYSASSLATTSFSHSTDKHAPPASAAPSCRRSVIGMPSELAFPA
jgi:hypothetical protein